MQTSPDIYQVKVKDHIFLLKPDDVYKMDITTENANQYHLIKDHISVSAAIEQKSSDAKTITVKIDGESFTVSIKDGLDQMLEQMGFGLAAQKQIKEVKAPMPGLVLEINVTTGDEVKQGSKLLILEAMKMENSIMVPVDAIIKKINVTKGQAVEKGQVLAELE